MESLAAKEPYRLVMAMACNSGARAEGLLTGTAFIDTLAPNG